MSTALTTPAATTGPEARERSGHDLSLIHI